MIKMNKKVSSGRILFFSTHCLEFFHGSFECQKYTPISKSLTIKFDNFMLYIWINNKNGMGNIGRSANKILAFR